MAMIKTCKCGRPAYLVFAMCAVCLTEADNALDAAYKAAYDRRAAR